MAFPAGAHLWNIGTARMKNINNLHSQTHHLHNSLIQSKTSHKSLTSDKRLSKPGVAGWAPFPKFYHPRKEYLWMSSSPHNILEKHNPTCGSLIHLRSENLHNENRSAKEKEARPVSLVFVTPNQYKSRGRICQSTKIILRNPLLTSGLPPILPTHSLKRAFREQ
jgi:hypothetical protein